MILPELFINYWIWHYTLAIRDLAGIWSDFIRFLWSYFSIKQLVRTFFEPWRRLGETPISIFDFFNYFSAVLVTFLMRLAGVAVRSAVILAGLIAIFLAGVLGLAFLFAWLLAPVVLLVILGVGIQLTIRPF